MADEYVLVPMTLNGPYPGFQGHCIVTSQISQKTVRHRDNVTIEH